MAGARRLVGRFVEPSHTAGWHRALGYVRPKAKLAGRGEEIFAARARKRDEARARRKAKRPAARQAALGGRPAITTT